MNIGIITRGVNTLVGQPGEVSSMNIGRVTKGGSSSSSSSSSISSRTDRWVYFQQNAGL